MMKGAEYTHDMRSNSDPGWLEESPQNKTKDTIPGGK